MSGHVHAHVKPASSLVAAFTLAPSGLLQRTCACGGTHGVDGMCEECRGKRLTGVQTKLRVNEPGDRYEQEADRIADEVMRVPEPTVQREEVPEEDEEDETLQMKPLAKQITPLVQRETISEEEGEEEIALQRQALTDDEEPDEEEEEEVVQTKRAGSKVPTVTSSVEAAISECATGGGEPLDAATREFMEPRFGHDFAHVRVHTDARAAAAARTVSARAFTIGSDVVFGAGQYTLGKGEGQQLLAHELVHTIQQDCSERRGSATCSSPAVQRKDAHRDVEHANPPSRAPGDALGDSSPGDAAAEGVERPGSDESRGAEVVRCAPGVAFALRGFTARLAKAFPALDFGEMEPGQTENHGFNPWEFRARAVVQGIGDPDALEQWRIGFTQTVNPATVVMACARSGGIQENRIRRPLTDCAEGTAWYAGQQKVANSGRQGLRMSDTPRVSFLVEARGEQLRCLRSDFSATAFLIARKEQTGEICHLRWARWGYLGAGLTLDERAKPNVELGEPFFPQGSGKGSNAFVFDAGTCANDVRAVSAPGPCRCAAAKRPRGQNITTTREHPDSRTQLKEKIRAYREKATYIAGVRCMGGEIVPDLPEELAEAPCGIARCVEQHELSHGADITRLFRERLGRHPCRHEDETPVGDGFSGFAEDFVSYTGEHRAWRSFLLRSERAAYGTEVRCLRDARKRSTEPLCRRALAQEAAKSAFHRFLAAIGINPGI
jgi:hypothetical protein